MSDKLQYLNMQQMERVRNNARATARRAIGTPPSRETFKHHADQTFTFLHGMFLFGALAAMVISTLRIWQYIGATTAANHKEVVSGAIAVGQSEFVVINQLAFVILAELSMFVSGTWALHDERRWVKFAFGLLSISSAGFVLYANWRSGEGFLLAILPPLFTILGAVIFEQLLAAQLANRRIVNNHYHKAMEGHRLALASIDEHFEFKSSLRLGIREAMLRLKPNKKYVNAPDQFWLDAINAQLQMHAMLTGAAATATALVETLPLTEEAKRKRPLIMVTPAITNTPNQIL